MNGGWKDQERPLDVIAREIRENWKLAKGGINYAAVPYLSAMLTLSSIDNPYHFDSGKSIVAYFLANAGTWRGDVARRVKAELREMLKRRGYT